MIDEKFKYNYKRLQYNANSIIERGYSLSKIERCKNYIDIIDLYLCTGYHTHNNIDYYCECYNLLKATSAELLGYFIDDYNDKRWEYLEVIRYEI